MPHFRLTIYHPGVMWLWRCEIGHVEPSTVTSTHNIVDNTRSATFTQEHFSLMYCYRAITQAGDYSHYQLYMSMWFPQHLYSVYKAHDVTLGACSMHKDKEIKKTVSLNMDHLTLWVLANFNNNIIIIIIIDCNWVDTRWQW
jgi:hypothetical protein